jgi:uncharacterized protein YndB with AHSA1/START domain
MKTSSTDRIQKDVTLSAAPSRVWRAISDAGEFGQWFGVVLEGQFRAGETIRGRITCPGCEHMILRARVERMEPEHTFAMRWCPYALDPDKDYADEPTTLVEFRLAPAGAGTHLSITESGFDALPAEHRSECFIRNEGGWTEQVASIARHVDG